MLKVLFYDNILSCKCDSSHLDRPIGWRRLSKIFDSYIQISTTRVLIRFYYFSDSLSFTVSTVRFGRLLKITADDAK